MDNFDNFSQALQERIRNEPELALQVAQNIHTALTQRGLPSPGALPIAMRLRPINTVGGGDGGGSVGGGGGHVGGGGVGGGGGGTVPAVTPVTVEAFWWGFHFVIPHDALQAILFSADVVNTFVSLIGPETGPAAPFVELAAALVAKMLEIMRNMDTGKGIYFSMTWLLPGAFVPTPI